MQCTASLLHAQYGWSAWHCSTNGQRLAQGPAPDGETFFITALLFASKRWGNTGTYNYLLWANTILHAVQTKEDPPCGPQGCAPAHVVNM